jgi:hypothetical protein
MYVCILVLSVLRLKQYEPQRGSSGSSVDTQNMTENYETDSKIPKYPHGGSYSVGSGRSS